MLCYRCGSYNADSAKRCEVCGEAVVATQKPLRPVALALKSPVEIGTSIGGRHRVLGAAAAGAVGFVLRCRDEEAQTTVALKLPSPELLGDAKARERWDAAVEAARALPQAHLARITDVGSDAGQPYYTSSWLEGVSLRRILDARLEARELWSPVDTLPLLQQLAQACDALGALAPHGALRPSSILVLPDMLRLTGLPHWRGLPRHAFLRCLELRESLAYVAPEARKVEADAARADVYSVAVIAAEMLTGRVVERSRGGPARSLSPLAKPLKDVLACGLSEDPRQRFESVGALAHAFAATLVSAQETREEQGEAPAPVVLRRSTASVSRRVEKPRRNVGSLRLPARRVLALGAVSLVLVAAATGLIWRAWPSATANARSTTAVTRPLPPVASALVTPSVVSQAPTAIEAPRARRPELTPATDAEACPEGMAKVAPGRFSFGSAANDPERGFGELEARVVGVPPFCIDTFEYPNEPGAAPLTGVSFAKARLLCEKQGKRLCSESEWEGACVGTRQSRYPFGSAWRDGVCNIGVGSGAQPAASGEFAECRSDAGVVDLSGNVAEWTITKFTSGASDRVVKGGGTGEASYLGRCAARTNEAPSGRRQNLGFRCCADL